MALTVVIAYDVRSDRQRARIASRLQAWGDRIQRSVFLCILGPDELERLLKVVAPLIDVTRDTLHVIPVCGTCRSGVLTFGQATFELPPLHWFV